MCISYIPTLHHRYPFLSIFLALDLFPPIYCSSMKAGRSLRRLRRESTREPSYYEKALFESFKSYSGFALDFICIDIRLKGDIASVFSVKDLNYLTDIALRKIFGYFG